MKRICVLTLLLPVMCFFASCSPNEPLPPTPRPASPAGNNPGAVQSSFINTGNTVSSPGVYCHDQSALFTITGSGADNTCIITLGNKPFLKSTYQIVNQNAGQLGPGQAFIEIREMKDAGTKKHTYVSTSGTVTVSVIADKVHAEFNRIELVSADNPKQPNIRASTYLVCK